MLSQVSNAPKIPALQPKKAEVFTASVWSDGAPTCMGTAWHGEDWKPWAPIRWVAQWPTGRYPKVQGTQELPMPKVGRCWEDGKSEVFNDFCVHAPSVPSCCRWFSQLPERADASVEPTSIGPGGNLLSTATPCCFTHLHSTACNWQQMERSCELKCPPVVDEVVM